MTLTFEAPPVVSWNSNVYALAFSPDGARLAVGSGGWYGGGGISLVDVATGEDATLRFVGVGAAPRVAGAARFVGTDASLTISGVAFDASGEHVAACAWSSAQHAGPAFLFRVAGGALEHRETFVLPEDDEGIFDRCPTGVCFADRALVVRSNARRLEDVLAVLPIPSEVDAGVTSAHRAHARIACVGGELLTGGGGSLKLGGWSVREGEYEAFRAAPGLVVGPRARAIDGPGARITAVLARPDGTLITGGLTGEIVAWERGDDWRPVRWLRDATERRATIGGAWATYRPESVVALCALEDGRFFSADASGEILEWHGETVARTHALPRPGTPRALAAHPDTPRGALLAVGLKCEGKERRGYVACFSLR